MKLLNRFFDKLTRNYQAFLATVLAVVALTALVVFFLSRKDAKVAEANNALFIAQKAVEQDHKALAEASAPAAPVAKAGKDAAPKAPVSPETVRFQRLDVDAKLGSGAAKLKAVAEKYPSTRAGFEAKLALGSLYFEHGDAAKALPWLEKATQHSGVSPFDKATALMALGHAYENSGKPKEALQSFEKALATGDTVAKGAALLSIARAHELLKDTAKARSTYDQIISQLPSTEHAKIAEARKATLE